MTSKKSHIELQDITGSNKSSDRESLLHYNTKNDSKISEVKAEPEQTKYYLDSSHYRHSIQTTNDEHHDDQQKEKVATNQGFPGNGNENESLPFPKLLKIFSHKYKNYPRDKNVSNGDSS